MQKVEQPLVRYRHHAEGGSLCSKTPRRLLLKVRAKSFEERVLRQQWEGREFTIWGAGRDGKAFFNLLSVESKRRVKAFCDIACHHQAAKNLQCTFLNGCNTSS